MPTERIEQLNRDTESLLAHGRALLDRVVARVTGAPVVVELDIGLLEYVALYIEAVQWHLLHARETLIPHDHTSGADDHGTLPPPPAPPTAPVLDELEEQLANERAELLLAVAQQRRFLETLKLRGTPLLGLPLFLDAVEEHLHNAGAAQ